MSENSPDHPRTDWLRLADRMLAAARRHASPGHARITPPGAEGGYGRAIDGLEGFARTFLLAGFRLAGSPADPDGLAEWYATGLTNGTDPHMPDRWTRLDEHGQAKVEAASIALVLDLTRPWIWDRLEPAAQERIVDYLSPAVGDRTYPQTNWVWFRLVVQTFLRSVGGPWSGTDMLEDLATHDSFRRADGWLADGPTRAYDHYNGWALHVYPILWSRMSGAEDLAASRIGRYRADLDRFLLDAVNLIGADGSPLIQGRSLTYRFAAAAPFWAGALAEVPSLSPGLLRHAADRIVHHFADRGAPDAAGLLDIGWHGAWRPLAQSYSGPGSPYWASKGMLGLALPADHPVWTAPAEPLPIDRGDVLRAVEAPGWLVSGVRADGIVRVLNHGTDHEVAGAAVGDSPLYARLGYSTATAPLLDETGWTNPGDQSVVLVGADGRSTHRAGFRSLGARVDGAVGVAGSTGPVHWLDPAPVRREHGGGRPGVVTVAGVVTVYSLVRGAWEIRLAAADRVATLRMSGWPVTGELASHLIPLAVGGPDPGTTRAGLEERADAGPLGSPTRVPWLEWQVGPGEWIAALVALTRDPTPPGADAHIDHGLEVRVTWPDGVQTRTPLENTRQQNGKEK
ncbi:DUF2264 domain-containing protein [Paractinoplanes ferrugineus]|uniref:DUF2264 domain-containing protein n=1 Tax=Paractinoplanes ferrugineus TaxID=113564 RepID=A0A919IXM8_9ACTN|nr:DUF2264 domain-containing protein [Actinoplanes ferrugineus]GIE10961.1 hypothetical protein Afe05nite_28010 [Actinoplanes ferrugineus]